MAYDLERRPGGFALTRGERTMRIAGVYLALVLASVALALVLLLTGALEPVASVALVGAVLIARPFFNGALDAATPWLKGGNAEAAVGEALDELRRERFVVMHDLENVVGGNVDHLVAGPSGVFMVETKFRRYQDHELGKAKHVAAKIGGELGVWVQPVICVAKRDYGPKPTHGVVVVGKRQLVPYIRSQHKPPVDFERLARFADRQ